MASTSRHEVKALADKYKRSIFDAKREQIFQSMEDDKDTKNAFISAVKDRVERTLQAEVGRGAPERSEDEEVEMVMQELDRYPIIDNLVEKLTAEPQLIRGMKAELQAILDKS